MDIAQMLPAIGSIAFALFILVMLVITVPRIIKTRRERKAEPPAKTPGPTDGEIITSTVTKLMMRNDTEGNITAWYHFEDGKDVIVERRPEALQDIAAGDIVTYKTTVHPESGMIDYTVVDIDRSNRPPEDTDSIK